MACSLVGFGRNLEEEVEDHEGLEGDGNIDGDGLESGARAEARWRRARSMLRCFLTRSVSSHRAGCIRNSSEMEMLWFNGLVERVSELVCVATWGMD